MIEYTQETKTDLVTKFRKFVEVDRLGPEANAILQNPKTNELRAVKVRRNEQCPCGSGLKFKKCCLGKVNCGAEIVI